MASMSVARIKREFKEVMKSQEVRPLFPAYFVTSQALGASLLQQHIVALFVFFLQIVECAIKIELMKDSWTELRGEIAGPPDTPYEGGKFQLEIVVPETYPFNPPKVRFITKIWHPNISSVTGAICLDILKENWAAAMTLRTVLLSLQALLSAAEPDDPQDAVVASQFKENHEMFVLTARHWTTAYANGKTVHNERNRRRRLLK